MEKFNRRHVKNIFDKPIESHNTFISGQQLQEKAINGENSYNNSNDYNNNKFNDEFNDNNNGINGNNGISDSNGQEEDDLFDEDFIKDGFGSKLKIWSERETEFLKQFQESGNSFAKLKPGDKQKLWKIRDKYKTLRRIRNGNTKRLMDQFENLY